MARLFWYPQTVILAQRGFLFPWSPVFLAIGIGLYFALRGEPPVGVLWLCLGAGGLGVLFNARVGAVFGPLVVALALLSAGFGWAGLRAHWVAGPVLDFRYYGAIEGRVVNIDRSASDALRLTLDRVVLERMEPAETPARVRVSLHGEQGFLDPKPGALVILTGHLSAPGGAVEPGGFDFRRHAWFLRLGGVGYTRVPALLLEPPGPGQAVFKARMWLSARVQAGLGGEAGAFAAAVMTGDRSGMGQGTLQDLRDTNLAHLLAISGLHMGLLAGFVFAVLRLALLLHPHSRNVWPVKKLAAFGALCAGFGYLLLSGGNVATERAFIMAAVALTALMLDRRAISLRAVGMAALIVLIWEPQALLGPGFQMSFAATTALVAVFEGITRRGLMQDWPRWAAPLAGLAISSAVAGFATAPVGMAHFNQAATYGLIANLISVPVMGILVVPLGVIAALLMPFGLDHIALAVMGLGLDWILLVADTISQWSGATRAVVAPQAGVLPVLALGGLILCIWQGRGRLAGLAPAALAIGLWATTERPEMLISDNGALVGVMTDRGRALSRETGSRFIADNWLENDGWSGTREEAAALWPRPEVKRVAVPEFAGREIVHLQGKTAARGFTRCDADQIVISSAALSLQGPCLVFDPNSLRQTGSVALRALPGGGLDMRTATETSGRRLWHGAEPESLLLAQRKDR